MNEAILAIGKNHRAHLYAIFAILVAICCVIVRPRFCLGADVDDGAKVVARRCAQCHGPSGMGDGKSLKELNIPVKPVPWPDKERMAKFSDADLTAIITHGGKSIGKSAAMPKFQNKLTDEQIADCVAYVRSLAR